jgi:hypothetical protein
MCHKKSKNVMLVNYQLVLLSVVLKFHFSKKTQRYLVKSGKLGGK